MRLISIFLLSIIINIITLTHKSFADYSCSLKINAIDFGNFNPYNYTANKLSSSINVQCIATQGANQVSYIITFSPGNSGNATNRMMLNDKKNLVYNLYADSALTQVLGNGYSQTNSFSISYLLDAQDGARNDNFIIYGIVPIQPLSEEGQYYDSIVVTLTY